MDGYDQPCNSKRQKLNNAVDDLWRKSAPNFLNLLRVMFEKQIHADVTLQVELGNTSRKIECQSLVLSAHSPVFSAMLSGRCNRDTNNENKNLLILKDNDPDHFLFFVKMMYWDWNEENFASYVIPAGVTLKLAVRVLSLAHKYLATYVIRQAEHLIFCFLSKRSAADTIELYLLLKRLPICKRGQVARKTLRTVENCLAADGEHIFSSEAITQLHQIDLAAIVRRYSLKCSEKTIYNGCLKWAQKQCKAKGLTETGENLRSVLKNTLERIRFPLMDKLTIANEVLPANILTQEDVNNLLAYLFIKGCPDAKDNSTKFSTKRRHDPNQLLIKRLDLWEVSKDNPVDLSFPRGFTMTLSKSMLLCGMELFCGESTPRIDAFFAEVEVLKKKFSVTKAIKTLNNNGCKRPRVYIAIQPMVQIPANVPAKLKFSITGDTNIVFTEVMEETRKEISYWRNKTIFITFEPSPNIPNGLMQVPRLFFSPTDAETDTDTTSSDSDGDIDNC